MRPARERILLGGCSAGAKPIRSDDATKARYYSAYGDNETSEEAVKTCGDAFLRKPLCIADIERTLAELLKQKAERKT